MYRDAASRPERETKAVGAVFEGCFELIEKRPLRLLIAIVAVFAIGCTSATPTPNLTPTPAPVVTPTPTRAQATPTAVEPKPSPSAPPTGGPTATETPSVSPSPSAAPTPTTQPTPLGSFSPPRTLTPDTGTAQQLGPQLQAVLDAQRETVGIPGIGAAIAFPDGSIWASGSGVASIATQEPGAGDTPFVVGSISKTFVAATIMQLADEGRLSIDDPLAKWMPDYPDAQNITIRQLLHHTSGIYDYFAAPNYDALVFGSLTGHAWTPEEILSTFAHAPYFPPGTDYHYSNTNFILLGMVVEQITGQQLGDVYRQRFFAPLGMADTYFQGSGPPPATAAAGYLLRGRGLREQTDGSDYRPTVSGATVAWAAGSIDGSARDLTVWGDALYGGHLVRPEDLAQMEDWTYYPKTDETYGLGTRSRIIEGERVFGHTGSIRGFDAAMWHFPDTDMTITVLTNLGRIEANPIVDALAAVAYPQPTARARPSSFSKGLRSAHALTVVALPAATAYRGSN